MQNILERESLKICKDLLDIIDNNKVKVELDSKSNTSLYVFLTNTIYISNKEVKGKKSLKEKNKSKILVIAHECTHSMQAKSLQVLNFVLSNVEILLFLAIVFMAFVLKYTNPLITYLYLGIIASSIGIRLGLEIDATIKSVRLVAKYLISQGVETKQVKELVMYYKRNLIKTLPFFVLSLYLTKIARLMIVLVI